MPTDRVIYIAHIWRVHMTCECVYSDSACTREHYRVYKQWKTNQNNYPRNVFYIRARKHSIYICLNWTEPIELINWTELCVFTVLSSVWYASLWAYTALLLKWEWYRVWESNLYTVTCNQQEQPLLFVIPTTLSLCVCVYQFKMNAYTHEKLERDIYLLLSARLVAADAVFCALAFIVCLALHNYTLYTVHTRIVYMENRFFEAVCGWREQIRSDAESIIYEKRFSEIRRICMDTAGLNDI